MIFFIKKGYKEIFYIHYTVHLVLLPHGIAPTFLELDSWSPGTGVYSYYIHQGNKSDKERKIVRNTKSFNTFFKDGCNSVWVQFHV